jgi:hypothetical protein
MMSGMKRGKEHCRESSANDPDIPAPGFSPSPGVPPNSLFTLTNKLLFPENKKWVAEKHTRNCLSGSKKDYDTAK